VHPPRFEIEPESSVEPSVTTPAGTRPRLVEAAGPQGRAQLSLFARAPIRLVEGDNLLALEALAGEGAQVHLAYLDPPFFTQRLHQRTVRSRDDRTGKLRRERSAAFDDRWPSLGAYLGALRARIERVRELLTEDGSMVVHVDPTTSHYVKVMCDEIFGERAFASEIVWRYRRWPAKTRNFQRVHDVLLRYLRDARKPPRFCQLYEPLAASTRATWGVTKQLACYDADGRRVRSSRTAEPTPGVPLGDVWEIGVIAPVARERTGYPTQKPEALLERVVRSSSYEGDVVLDPYAGSGTSLVVAGRTHRRAIGVDDSPAAIGVTRRRLEAEGIAYRFEEVAASAPRAG
jgi:site-specific DNA-methyltransferase (adenine-specific)